MCLNGLLLLLYNGAKSKVRVIGSYSDEFDVKVGVNQGSVFSPLLFTIVLKALSTEFRTSCPWELLYVDDLVLIAETLDLLMEKLKLWKDNMENKGLRVNMGENKSDHLWERFGYYKTIWQVSM